VANGEEKNMDDVVNQLAKELADAIGAAVADNAKIEACRAKAREAGFDLRPPRRRACCRASASTSSRATIAASCARCVSAATNRKKRRWNRLQAFA
jgi:hypothetical protein